MVLVKKCVYILFIGFALFISCRKSFQANWDADVLSPIARSHLDIKNFFNDSLFKSGSDGLLHLAFTRKIAGFNLDSLIKIPDTTLVNTFTLIPGFAVSAGQNLPTFPQTQDVDFKIANGAELKKAIIQKGFIKVIYSNTFTQPLSFNLTLPSAKKWGVPFQIQETINPGSNSLIKYYDISGYDITLTGLNQNKTNTLPQTININVASTAQADVTQAGQKVQADVSYENLIPYYLEGYFGEQFIEIPYDSLKLDISKNIQSGNFQIHSAYINFKIVNEFGVDVNAKLEKIKSVNSFSQTSILLNASGLSNLNINRAGKTNQFGNPVFPSVKSVSVNTDNSNLKPFLENLPDYLTYSGEIKINPFGNISGSNDFAFYGTGINIYADIDLPLQIKADYFKLITETPIDVSEIEQLNNINYGNLILQATNGFPFKAIIQGYVLNEHNQISDSLFNGTNNIIERGIINTNNQVTQSVYSKLIIPLTQNKIQNMKQGKKIRFVSTFIMPSSPPDIKIYENYNLDLILSVDVNYNVKTK